VTTATIQLPRVRAKQLRARPRITIAERRFKRYHVNGDGSEIPGDVQEAAYRFVPHLLPPLDDTEPAGFIVLHQGVGGVSLTVHSWVAHNLLHTRRAVAGEPCAGGVAGDLTTFAVVEQPLVGSTWELAPLAHEPAAWIRHVVDAEVPDVHAYLADLLPDGPVGDGTR
jgi:hypothetical protein